MNKFVKKVTSGILLCTVLAYATPVLAYTKDETVYTKIDGNGKNYKTIVTNHLSGEEELINDLTDLINIKNVNGDEEFSQEGNKIIWKSNGNDIYYQGESKKELPVDCNIKYELDGKEMSKEEITGKSGKIKITIQYTNKDEHTVKIAGKNTTLYTPFIVGTGIIFNNENSKNIETSNGKIVDDGSKTIVAGIVVPGLQESLGLNKDVIDIPDSIEITMDADNFEIGTMIAYITPKLLEESDLEIFDKLEDVYTQVDKLQQASQEIEKGANTLAEGATTFSEKSQEFNNAMNQVQNGVANATNSYNQIDDGINTLNKNTGALESGAKNLSDGSKALSEGITTIDENVGKLEAGAKALESGEATLSAGIDQVIAGVNGIKIEDNSKEIENLQKLVEANQDTINKLNETNKSLEKMLEVSTDETTISNLQTQIESNKQLIGLLQMNVKAQNETISTLQATDMSKIQALQQGLTGIKQGITEIQSGTSNLSNGLTQLKQGTSTIADKTQELVSGTSQLYNGTKQVSVGTKALRSGSLDMKTGLNTINGATTQLRDADNVLTDGAITIADGATTLSDGISEFNRTGINKICDYVNNDIKDITNRLEKLQQLSEEYNSFTMKDEEVKGNVEFIIIMEDKKEE